MPSCLGIYIEEHLIKYAKVSKEHENIKVEAFGIKFYDKIGDAISQVIEETYSQKTPISVNMSEEMYNYFDMFALLTKTDLQKAIKTEFESYCSEKGYNPNVFERRYAVVDNQLDKEKIKVIHIADNKIELNKRIQEIDGYKLTNISPISMSIPNLINIEPNENCIIVNMEDKTTITTIIDSKIYHVDVLDEGSTDILSKINLKENSYSKSYEICKNTTIYTSEGKELQDEQTNYLEDIMPTLYTIVSNTQKIINSTTEKINKVYITGTAALVNNVDLYFQEYLTESNCEILKPYFINNTKDISIKADLVEEIARIYGYDNIEPQTKNQPLRIVEIDDEKKTENTIKDLLAIKYGLSEIHTYIWYDRKKNKELNLEVNENNIKLANSLNANFNVLRESMIPSLLYTLSENIKYYPNVNIFECGRTFEYPNKGEECIENKNLGIALCSKNKSSKELIYKRN